MVDIAGTAINVSAAAPGVAGTSMLKKAMDTEPPRVAQTILQKALDPTGRSEPRPGLPRHRGLKLDITV